MTLTHDPLQVYCEVWGRSGRAGAVRMALELQKHDAPSTCLALCLVLLDSGLLSPFDLRLTRFVYDRIHPDDTAVDASDQQLQAFALAMVSSLAEGNVYLPAGAAWASALAQTIGRALTQCNAGASVPSNVIQTAQSAIAPHGMLEQLAESFENRFGQGAYDALVGDVARVVVRDSERYYFERYYRAESAVRDILDTRLQRPALSQSDRLGRIAHALADIALTHPLRTLSGKVLELDYRQTAAVALCALTNTAVITGGPGTGKTTVAAQILRLLVRLDPSLNASEDILLCAPTGRAAARLTQSITALTPGELAPDQALRSVTGRTVHSVLGYDPTTGQFRRGTDSPIDSSVVIVDEVSMIDIAVFRHLLEALRDDTTLILLGDRHQLPSVEAGAVLGSLAGPFDGGGASLSPSMRDLLSRVAPSPELDSLVCDRAGALRDHLVILTRSHRSGSAIMDIAALVNTQTPVPDTSTYEATRRVFAETVSHVAPAGTTQGVVALQSISPMRAVSEWVRAHYGVAYRDSLNKLTGAIDGPEPSLAITQSVQAQSLARRVLEFLTASVVLCVVRRGEYGSETANDTAARILRPRTSPHAEEFFHGAPVLVTRNSRALGLWNGDRGVVLEVNRRQFVLFERRDTCALMPLADIPSLELSAAMTVHKSQGSEFGEVMFLLAEPHHPLLTREIVYTALTRAKRSVALVGSPDALDSAVARRVSRRSALDSYLGDAK